MNLASQQRSLRRHKTDFYSASGNSKERIQHTHLPPSFNRFPISFGTKNGEPADTHKFLIVLINDVSEPISQLFQGQMSSTVNCSICERSTIKTDNTQDYSLQIDEDANLSLVKTAYMTSFNRRHSKGETHTGATHAKESARRQNPSFTHEPLRS